ncbi:hypothetical protein DESPIG_02190 [Desulfovibrio piger ATCC 29098]|uniref:Uncharacterized protein n=1 Tax=Desulfovibrio piger ATCC 29098 TaxID=411464 RepID=B6WVS2_9BACT|nr:hypothetical protein DESPIG_02190 [Desulfovibrio piger ATCC 29098]
MEKGFLLPPHAPPYPSKNFYYGPEWPNEQQERLSLRGEALFGLGNVKMPSASGDGGKATFSSRTS